jgi:hypothetical protein
MSAMQAAHDHIAAVFPDICPMGSGSVGAVGSTAGASSPAQPFSSRTSADFGTPNFPDGSPPSGLGWAGKKKKKPKTQETVTPDNENDENDDDGDKGAAPDITKLITSDSAKMLMDSPIFKDAFKVMLSAEIEKSTVEHQREIKKLKKRLNFLESEPDPAANATRASTVIMHKTEQRAQEEEAMAIKQVRQERRAERIAYLKKVAHSGHPELRLRAETELEKLLDGGEPDGDEVSA